VREKLREDSGLWIKEGEYRVWKWLFAYPQIIFTGYDIGVTNYFSEEK